MGSEPPALEGVAVAAAQGGELEGGTQGPLQPDGRAPAVLGKREQREVDPLHPRGLAPKRLRDEIIEQDGRGKQQQKRKDRRRGGAEGKEQSNDKWSMPEFGVDPGGAGLVAGRYTANSRQCSHR